jgi:hypothetical protein
MLGINHCRELEVRDNSLWATSEPVGIEKSFTCNFDVMVVNKALI